MESGKVLETFAQGVETRFRTKYGWINIIVALLPVIIDIINNCRNQRALQNFAEGKRTLLQEAGLRRKCRQVVRDAGITGVFRVNTAANALYDSMMDELSEASQRFGSSGDIYQQALDEAAGAI